MNKKPNFTGWLSGLGFDERQIRLISNCIDYTSNDPAGMPGHNLAIIVTKFAELLSQAGTIKDADGADRA